MFRVRTFFNLIFVRSKYLKIAFFLIFVKNSLIELYSS